MKNVNHLILGGAKGHVADMKHLRRCGAAAVAGALLHNELAAVQQVRPAMQCDVYMHELMKCGFSIGKWGFIYSGHLYRTNSTHSNNRQNLKNGKQTNRSVQLRI